MLDADDFERAVRPLLRRSAGYATSLLGDRTLAEDAVQQAALRAWERRAQYDARLPFAGWWFGVLRHRCLDVLRARRRTPVMEEAAEVALASDGSADTVLDRHALEAALARLPEAQRDVLRLRYHGDLEYAAIAAALAIPVGTVMSRLHHARRALAALLEPGDPA